MLASEIARQRLVHQGVSRPVFEHPAEVVGWLGAVQAQDYAGAKWAVAQRTKGIVSDAAMDELFAEGAILRTHLLRPTWHFVTPADIRWLLDLTAARVHILNGTYYRKLALDDTTFERSHAALFKALQGGMQLTRPEVAAVLRQAGIATDDMRFTYLMMHAELEGVVCSGARRGKQFTYALLDERAPQAKRLDRDEALAELVRRYMMSHGPATLKDFVWWSGLTLADARAGIELVKPQLEHEVIDGQSYWFAASVPPARKRTPAAYLLPNYDEALASYKDRSAAVEAQYARMWNGEHAILSHHLVINDRIAGSWQRTFSKGTAVVEIKLFAPLTEVETHAVAAATHRYGEFLGMPAVLRPETARLQMSNA
jgi:hypothetical protein